MINLAHKHKISGVGETTMDESEFGSQSLMFSSKDDSFFLPGSSKPHESTSEETSVSGKMATSESRKDRFRNNGTNKASGR